jgi:TusA-related sulfurtransferase
MADKSLEEIKRGEQAAVILDNPVYQDAINRVRENIVNSMTNSAIGDEKTHNRLVIALQLLNQINKQLTDVMQTGKLASIQTDRPKFKIFG